jgi:hypothetical protein
VLGVLDVGRGVDEPEVGGDLLALGIGDVAQAGADLMDDAGLHPCLREDSLDRLREAGEAVDAGDQHVLDAALVQVVEHGQPELGALGLLPPDPEHLAVALGGLTDRQIARS